MSRISLVSSDSTTIVSEFAVMLGEMFDLFDRGLKTVTFGGLWNKRYMADIQN